MASRIAASASGLAKDLVGSSSGNDLTRTLASSSSMSGKSQSFQTSAGPSTWSETLPSRTNGHSSSASHPSNGAQGGYESFRPPAPQHSEAFDMNDFLRGPEHRTELGALNAGIEPSWTAQFHHQSFQHSSFPTFSNDAHPTMDSILSYDDGAEVRALLSDSTFTADTYPTDVTMEDPTEASISDLFPQNFSEEEQHAADRIRSSLPAPPVHRSVPHDHPLNLRPDFASFGAANPHLQQEIAELASTLGSGEESYIYFTTPTQRGHWLSDWDDVLNSYTDDVWGELLPAVQVARAQVKEAMAGADQLDSKAVVRLKMILGHVIEKQASISTADVTESRVREAETDGLEATSFRNGTHHSFLDATKSMNGFMNGYAPQSTLHHQALPYHTRPGQADSVHPHLNRTQHHSKDVTRQNGHPEQRTATNEPREEEREIPIPDFHCPWISCHEVLSLNVVNHHGHSPSSLRALLLTLTPAVRQCSRAAPALGHP